MSIKGLIATNLVFHDTDATGTSLKIGSLVGSESYTTGKVAVLTGTINTSAVSISLSPTDYKDADGQEVSISTLRKMAFAASGTAFCSYGQSIILRSANNEVSVSRVDDGAESIYLETTSGTSTYTLLLYGT